MKTHTFPSLLFGSLFIFLLLSLAACDRQNPQNDQTPGVNESNDGTPRLAIRQPFENVRQEPKTLTHKDPEKPGSYTLESGTVIHIPAQAFEYLDGAPVEGPVDIEFTEMHTAAEIITSGIPMKYIDEQGQVQWMQSAGMFQIEGFQNERPVRIAEGKTIDVDLASEVAGDYDFWVFDEEKGNWINEGPIEAREGSPREATPPAVQNEIKALKQRTQKEPVKPEINEANKLIFNDLDLSRCPELQGQKTVVLLYAGQDEQKAPQSNKWIREPGIWHKKTIVPAAEPGLYVLSLFGDKLYQIEVKAAPTALEMDKANQAYQQQLAEYQANIALLKDRQALIAKRNTFVRVARLRGFGRYNYDILWKRRDAIALKADFEFPGVSDLVKDLALVYLITDNGQTVVNFSQSDWDKFRFSPSSDNKILAVLPDNKVSVFSETAFKEQKEEMIAAAGNDFVFSMENRGETIESVADLDFILTEMSVEGAN